MINDSDPQKEGRAPIPLKPGSPSAARVADVAAKFIDRATGLLARQKKANYVLLRGFSTHPNMPRFEEAYGTKALAVAIYPMYRGLARLIEMDAPVVEGEFSDALAFLRSNCGRYDFFFLHFKKTDSYGEDGNFEGKVKRIEEADGFIPEILSLKPDVLLVTGDHSTPSTMKGHSWHPVPVILKGPCVLGGLSRRYTERECLRGELGILPSAALMGLALANAGRLRKFGA
jgi:2,3-bisphosphoglycerate-independent phosphoglycerate mutase